MTYPQDDVPRYQPGYRSQAATAPASEASPYVVREDQRVPGLRRTPREIANMLDMIADAWVTASQEDEAITQPLDALDDFRLWLTGGTDGSDAVEAWLDPDNWPEHRCD